MRIARKLKSIYLDLALLAEQGKVRGFLNNVGSADKLRILLEDIRDTIVEYQVCISLNYLVLHYLMFKADFITARYLQQELPDYCESHSYPFTHRSC